MTVTGSSVDISGPVIDVHAHAVPSSLSRSPTPSGTGTDFRSRGPSSSCSRSPRPAALRGFHRGPHAAENVDRRLLDMDATGVDYQILSLLPSLWWFDDAILDTVAAARQSNDDLLGRRSTPAAVSRLRASTAARCRRRDRRTRTGDGLRRRLGGAAHECQRTQLG